MHLNEFQETANKVVEAIDAKLSGSHDPDTTLIHLTEELGEVARQIYSQKIGRAKLDQENLAEEIADCMILLSRLAKCFDIRLQDAVDKKLQVLKERHKL